ncbi:Glycolate dehydrogenase, iron-sulfur subunit GlcF [hydrothermal vent metagenome]|uniref:Glycolate dehydrogenase, iron-sulfur subunit GlcF n=1 Tax=hydrothermal vent metagenome TaxID=652676 RepID=A0A3B0TT96_9ZZZZ
MKTEFSPEQLKNPGIAHADKILRKCVHCGFCTATCPTYKLLGDELDSPRGRIYLIKEMLENDRPATEEVVRHVDRCLSCLSCMTTCPSGVNYMHLVDHARAHIEKTYKRTGQDAFLRALLARMLPRPALFRLAMLPARVFRPFAGLLRRIPSMERLAAMLALAPRGRLARAEFSAPATLKGEGFRAGRVVIMRGCAQVVLRPQINDATVRILRRLGYEVVLAAKEGCCGSLTHHLGREDEALNSARRNIDAWLAEADRAGLDAIIINASGCGTTVKDYAHMLSEDPKYAGKAQRVAAMAQDISEFLAKIDIGPMAVKPGLTVAYHSACSLQHGQGIRSQPKDLLKTAGFVVKDIPQGHLCCGSAGTYNILQPKIARVLLKQKVENIETTSPDLIATGNIGCITQIATGTGIPIVHTVELLDWAMGGDCPRELSHLELPQSAGDDGAAEPSKRPNRQAAEPKKNLQTAEVV